MVVAIVASLLRQTVMTETFTAPPPSFGTDLDAQQALGS